jgi:hypothetical protein
VRFQYFSDRLRRLEGTCCFFSVIDVSEERNVSTLGLEKEAARSSETEVTIDQTTGRHILEDNYW